MTMAYTEFDTTPANLVDDIQTHVVASTDWAVLGGTFPHLLTATTTDGAAMIVDLAPSGPTTDTRRQPVRVWRAHTGTTGTDSKDFTLWNRCSTTGTSADPLHVIVSASKDCLYISVEGPRGGEANPDNASYGSVRTAFFLTALNPYFTGDTTPVVVCGGTASNSDVFGNSNPNAAVFVSVGSVAPNPAWVPATLSSVMPLQGAASSTFTPQQTAVLDSNKYYLYPLVVVERGGGIRGTLIDLFYGGFPVTMDSGNPFDIPGAAGETVTYSGKSYKLHRPLRGAYNGNSVNTMWTSFGAWNNSGFSQVGAYRDICYLIGVRTA